MQKLLTFLILASGCVTAAELPEETELKFAFYSSAWGENTDDGLRLVAYNQTRNQIQLTSISFLKTDEESEPININLNLTVPALGYADMDLPYIDLLLGNECIDRTMAENWKLVEVSNYTLNPSVRNLIIEDTDSFRIYQCVENVSTTWTSTYYRAREYEEWVLFHFENRREY
jgi:hypothetical protein|tara:strand:- start:10522 stop:11040 length:519 start_codon:yes stop_codon:yes gene_type:complete